MSERCNFLVADASGISQSTEWASPLPPSFPPRLNRSLLQLHLMAVEYQSWQLRASSSSCVIKYLHKPIRTIKTWPSLIWTAQPHWPAAQRCVCHFGFDLALSPTEPHETLCTNASTSVTLDGISANDVCWELWQLESVLCWVLTALWDGTH